MFYLILPGLAGNCPFGTKFCIIKLKCEWPQHDLCVQAFLAVSFQLNGLNWFKMQKSVWQEKRRN